MATYKFSPNYSFVLSFEKNFDKRYYQNWMRQNWWISIFVGITYVGFVFGLKKFMENRKPYQLRNFLILWNLALAVFSITATLRTLPEFIYVLKEYGYHFSVCNRSYMEHNPITACWSFLFILSKVPELLDTLFVLLRKQKLIFLHWFHHVITLLVSWYVYDNHPGMARWVVVMNYTVHAVMYSYYALRAMRFRIPRWISMSITSSQIVQMILGFVASVYSFVTIYTGNECDISKGSATAFFIIYSSLFLLFVNFFIGAYFVPAKKVANGKVE